MKYILFIDNDKDFLATRAEILSRKLKKAKFIPASTISDARQILEYNYINIAIVDIRLVDDNDEYDATGLELASNTKYRPIPKIILTAYPSYEAARDALKLAPDGELPPAVAFLSKTESTQKFIQTIQDVLDRYVRINEDLEIYWQRGGSFRYLLELIIPRIEEERLLERAWELEDLFRKLFYDNAQLTIGRILRFENGQADIEIFAHGGKKFSGSYVISVGLRDVIEDERERYQQFKPRKLKKGVTHYITSEETMRFGANLYRLVEGDVETMEDFASFYRRHNYDHLHEALNNLFHQTLARFYERNRVLKRNLDLQDAFPDWMAVLGESKVQVFTKKIQRICEIALDRNLGRIEARESSITFHLSETNPVLLPTPAKTTAFHDISFRQPLLYAAHHGRLKPESILVDYSGFTWVTNLRYVGQGSVLRDFVCLEEALLTELAGELTLSQLHAALDVLFTGEAKDALPPTWTTEQQKLFTASTQLLSMAQEIADAAPQAFHLGLLVCALLRLHAFDLQKTYYTRQEILPFIRALLIAGMLTERLISTLNTSDALPSQALHGLWIDEVNKIVWVEGDPKTLSPQETDIMLYLWRHAGELCTRKNILKEVLNEPIQGQPGELKIAESRLNSAMTRLRQKIEPDPNRPKYIITIRGQGYKLIL